MKNYRLEDNMWSNCLNSYIVVPILDLCTLALFHYLDFPRFWLFHSRDIAEPFIDKINSVAICGGLTHFLS